MQGSKIALTERLRKECRWDEASRFKDEYIAKLRAEGKPRKEAQQTAWEALEKQFPPLEAEPAGSEEGAYPADLIETGPLGSSDFHDDARWVYQQAYRSGGREAGGCPDAGSLGVAQVGEKK